MTERFLVELRFQFEVDDPSALTARVVSNFLAQEWETPPDEAMLLEHFGQPSEALKTLVLEVGLPRLEEALRGTIGRASVDARLLPFDEPFPHYS